jgi:bifunctional non-homologous end joining protein LigD
VLVDHRQNGSGKTIASAYSVRPRPAPVSTPLEWHELTPDLDLRGLTMAVVLERVARLGDLFAPVLRPHQSAGPALRRLEADSQDS